MSSRRQVLKLLGTSMMAGSFATTSSARKGKSKGRPETRVAPFADQKVSISHKLNHSITWIETVCDSTSKTRTRLQEFVDKIAVDVHIDGESINNSSQYWTDPFKWADDIYGVEWNYPTEPRPQGTYDFNLSLRMTEEYVAPSFDCENTKTIEGTIYVGQTEYTVTQDAGAGHAPDSVLSMDNV